MPLIYLDESRAFGGALDDAELPAETLSPGLRGGARASGPARPGRVFGMTARRCERRRSTAACWWIRPRRVAGQIAANADQLSDWDHDFQGRRARWLRSGRPSGSRGFGAAVFSNGMDCRRLEPRRSMPLGRRTRPLIVTGHQPELFHPGVWIKNFAAASIAAASGGVGLNLIVDNDVPKSSSIAVPTAESAGIRLTRVEFRSLGW